MAMPSLPELFDRLAESTDEVFDAESQFTTLLRKTIEDTDTITSEILNSWRHDRSQQQDVIDMLMNALTNTAEDGVNRQFTGEGPRVLVEALIKTLDIKSSSASVGLKLIDSKTKLLSAIRGRTLINNTTNTINDGVNVELQQALSQQSGD